MKNRELHVRVCCIIFLSYPGSPADAEAAISMLSLPDDIVNEARALHYQALQEKDNNG